jgi:tRNA threonylcarbamoyladenosine biosynthesis protein TsaB
LEYEMLLAIDTATRWLGLALHDGRKVIAEVGWQSVNTQTVELAPTVAAMLKRADIEAADLAGIAVAIGPGSYTGLRVGVGFAKGLALANNRRLIGVPTLDILAASLPRSDRQLVVVAEAGRTRVCAGFYKWKGKSWQATQEPDILEWEPLLEQVEPAAIMAGEITADAAKMIRISGKKLLLTPPADSTRRSGFLAEIGWFRLRRGRTDDPAELSPIYLRDPAGA